jgi:hypothetical protein
MDLDNVAHANIPQDKNTLQAFKNSLYNNNPILIGINLYSSFASAIAAGGIIPMPNLQTEVMLGSLPLMVTGYNDKTSLFTVRSSFGATYVDGNATQPIGDYGYFYLPYDYLTNPDLAADFWMVAKVGTHTKSTIYSNLAYYSSYAFSTTKYIVSAPFKVLSYLKSTFIG